MSLKSQALFIYSSKLSINYWPAERFHDSDIGFDTISLPRIAVRGNTQHRLCSTV